MRNIASNIQARLKDSINLMPHTIEKMLAHKLVTTASQETQRIMEKKSASQQLLKKHSETHHSDHTIGILEMKKSVKKPTVLKMTKPEKQWDLG
jgi:hypothetical protein